MLQVGTDNRLYDHNGERLYLRGAHTFVKCFGIDDDGYRQQWDIRYSQAGTVPTTCPPVARGGAYGAWLSYSYVNDASAYMKIVNLRKLGFNTVRIWVDNGVMTTAPFTDAVTGLSFPSEPDIIQKIIDWTRSLGMYVWITYWDASTPDADAETFWTAMAAAYATADNVVFDLQNEPGNSAGLIYNDPSHPQNTVAYNTVMPTITEWCARFDPIVTAIRGQGFAGPISVAPLGSLWGLDTIASALDNGSKPYLNDPNLIVGVHVYYFYQNTATDFVTTSLPGLTAYVRNYAKYHCVVCSEFGFTNDFNFADPTAAIAWAKSAAGWLQKECFNGVVGFVMEPGNNDAYNDILDPTTAALTTWGGILTEYNTFATDTVSSWIPIITSTGGSLVDTTGSIMKTRRDGRKVSVRLVLKTPNIGTASGPLLVELPSQAASNGYQTYTNCAKADGTQLLVQVIGRYAQITTYAGAFPAANGDTIFADFIYDAESSGFSYDGMTFDGTFGMLRAANLTGIADGKEGTAVFPITMTGGDGVEQRIITTNNSRFAIFRNSANKLQIQLRNASNTIIGACTSNITTMVSDGPQMVYAAWNLATPSVLLYINDASQGTTSTATNDNIDYTDTNVGIGQLVGGGNRLSAIMPFFWFNPAFLNPATALNRALFSDYKHNPLDLGVYGDKPLGGLPMIFIRQLDSVASMFINNGTGGGFTKNP